MSFKKPIVILFILAILTSCIEFNSILTSNNHRCFFQILTQNQKYKIDIYPEPSSSTYNFTIEYLNKSTSTYQLEQARSWISTQQSLHVHKLAAVSSTYKFCVYNPSPRYNLSYEISIQSGIDLLELHLLPNSSDTENMIAEMEWVKGEIERLREIYDRVGQMRVEAENVSKLVNGKLILCAIGFSIVAVLVNGFFYSKIRKALHQRKNI